MIALRSLPRTLIYALALVVALPLTPHASAAPSADLRAVRAQVEQLQEDAAEAGENAQAAKIQLNRLKNQLSAVQQ
ncbi:MAG: peptidoglycan endopeptidase, partial [Actinomycetota bacterium]